MRNALAEWSKRVPAEGYEGARKRYFGSPVQEFFDYQGRRYETTTEALWDRRSEGDLRVFIELSDASARSQRMILHDDLILAKPR